MKFDWKRPVDFIDPYSPEWAHYLHGVRPLEPNRIQGDFDHQLRTMEANPIVRRFYSDWIRTFPALTSAYWNVYRDENIRDLGSLSPFNNPAGCRNIVRKVLLLPEFAKRPVLAALKVTGDPYLRSEQRTNDSWFFSGLPTTGPLVESRNFDGASVMLRNFVDGESLSKYPCLTLAQRLDRTRSVVQFMKRFYDKPPDPFASARPLVERYEGPLSRAQPMFEHFGRAFPTNWRQLVAEQCRGTDNVLIHGDLHDGNILRLRSGEWVLIDPFQHFRGPREADIGYYCGAHSGFGNGELLITAAIEADPSLDESKVRFFSGFYRLAQAASMLMLRERGLDRGMQIFSSFRECMYEGLTLMGETELAGFYVHRFGNLPNRSPMNPSVRPKPPPFPHLSLSPD